MEYFESITPDGCIAIYKSRPGNTQLNFSFDPSYQETKIFLRVIHEFSSQNFGSIEIFGPEEKNICGSKFQVYCQQRGEITVVAIFSLPVDKQNLVDIGIFDW